MTVVQQDPDGPTHGAGLTTALRAPVPGFAAAAVVTMMVGLTTLHVGLEGIGPVAAGIAVAGLVAAISLVAVLAERHHPHAVFGLGNAVTLIRAGLVALLLAPLAAGTAPRWDVAALAGAALALDGVDGWAARRQGLTSAFGARFDMETDAALAALLALLALSGGVAGPAILILGFSRYAFVAAGAVWPWLLAPLPPSTARKAVCVIQISVLIALMVPVLPGAITPLLTWGAAALLAWSFGRDILFLFRTAG